MRVIALSITLALCVGATAHAQTKAINTGGEKGAYHSLFCPPLTPALASSYFAGYGCTPSKGTLDNIERVSKTPTQIGFAQLDVFAREAATDPITFKKLMVIRKDLACEGLFMVTRNPRLTDYGAVLALARRIPFVLPPEGSGAAASFSYLQTIDPDGIGRAQKQNIRHLSDATAVINHVAASNDGSVGFFVQFADPENANVKLIVEKDLRVIPVVSSEVVQAAIGDQTLYEVQTFNLTPSGIFAKGKEVTTACTPVAIFTGAPESFSDRGAQDDQRELVQRVRDINRERLLPQESRIAALLKGAKRISGRALEEMTAGVALARQKMEEATR